MLDGLLAQKLADRIMTQLGYNINIMNEKGIIIGSGDPDRIGDFHEIAYMIVRDKKDIEIVRAGDPKCIGVKPGVNMSILYENRPIGVIGISGNPDEILTFAYIVKMTVETMIEHELYKEQTIKRQNSKNIFLNSLLYEEPFDIAKPENLARMLGYDPFYIRIPIVINYFGEIELDLLMQIVKSANLHSKQDITLAINYNHVVIFKALSKNSINSYKHKVRQYVAEIDNAISSHNSKSNCTYYAATPIDKFKHYRQEFQFCQWMEKHLPLINGCVYFFIDYIGDYIQDMIPFSIYNTIFSIYKDFLGKDDIEPFIQTTQALFRNDLNISKTADQLYLHRNTVLFRLNKIKELFGINPLKSFSDQQFLYFLFHFYNNNRKN